MKQINSEEYEKLLFNKVSVFTSHPYIFERVKLEENGYPNIHQLYLDGQEYYLKKELEKYNFSDEKNLSMIKEVNKISEQLIMTAKKYNILKENELWEELIKKFKLFLEAWNLFIKFADVPVFCARNYETYFYDILKNKGLSDEDFDILTTNITQTFHQRREKDLFSLEQEKITKDEFIQKWSWSEMGVMKYHKVDETFINEQLLHLPDKQNNENHEDYKRVYETLSDELKKKADLAQEFIKVRDYRFECLLKSTYLIHKLFCAIASKLKISYNELIYMTPEEILSKTIPSNLNERLKGYAYYDKTIYTGKELENIKKMFYDKQEVKQIMGKGVSKGKIVGKVKIVLTKNELSKINKGDIIVCEMTTPEYTSGLKKVSGIITEIGGFTCHAAIIARELQKPCIIAANNATKMLKDNDLVELDANHGVIKIIK